MQLFYNEHIQANDLNFSFDKEESKHIVKVLRKREGDILNITNGRGYLFTCKITSAQEKKCDVAVQSQNYFEPKPYSIHIAIAPTKMNERIEWFLEKATEIGIHEITPIICEHSERKIYKTDRAEKICIAALKQSNQFYLPKINNPVPLKEFIHQNKTEQKYIAHCEDTNKKTLKSILKTNESVTILIGPEGDFSEAEIAWAEKNGYLAVSLGNTRLRTETAALVACHTIVLMHE